MEKKVTYKGKYNQNEVLFVLDLLAKGLKIRTIARTTAIPETTIRNWKFGYTKVYGENTKVNTFLQTKILKLLAKGNSIPNIARQLEIDYNSTQLFLKKVLSSQQYNTIKVSNGELLEESKTITPELAYILGVVYGDGYFGKYQIKLGAKDKEFVDYFCSLAEKWSKRSLTRFERLQNDKPYFECSLSFKSAARFVQEIVKNRTKIPSQIFNSNDEQIQIMFIKGMSDSEGTIITNKITQCNILRIYNQKRLILEQIREMMIRIGFNPRKIKVVFNNKAPGGDVYALRMCYNDQLNLFSHKIGFTIKRKQLKLQECLKEE